MRLRWRPLAFAVVTAIVVDVTVGWIQTLVARGVHPRPGEIRSVSDFVLATAFAAALYLWLSLRDTRAALGMAERTQLVLDTQLSLAAAVQRRLLPSPPAATDTPDIRWATRLRPAWKIGGDFYDFIPLADGTTLALVGDVSGKGIPAALLQTSAHALFRTYAGRTSNPAELLSLVSREVYAEDGGALYLTCIAIRVDARHGVITYVNAGHPPGLLIGLTGVRLLDKGGVPVGLFADAVYQPETLHLDPGDVGLLVTDGITEALEDDDRLRPADRLSELVLSLEPPLSADRISDAIMALAARASGPRGVTDWQDDKTVVVFDVEPERASAALPISA